MTNGEAATMVRAGLAEAGAPDAVVDILAPADEECQGLGVIYVTPLDQAQARELFLAFHRIDSLICERFGFAYVRPCPHDASGVSR